jgi:hypothetical protein
MTNPSESQIQATFMDLVNRYAGPKVIVVSIPNEGKRSASTGGKLKKQGMTPGAADVVATWARYPVYLEFKTATGTQSKEQEAFQIAAYEAGVPYHVVRDAYQAYDLLEQHGAPLKWVHRDGRFVVAKPEGIEMTEPEYKAFAREIMQFWPWGDVDGFALQEMAVKHGLLAEVEGGFDPDKHDDPTGACDRGDSFFLRTYDRTAGTEAKTPINET